MNKPVCVICGDILIMNNGIGHNPMPIAPAWTRCCDDCNSKYVVPVRCGQIPDNLEIETFLGRPLIITLWTATGLYNDGNVYVNKWGSKEKNEKKSREAVEKFAKGLRI
jgi:hypothetical protein